MTLDITPLLKPVSEASPAGEEARASEAYEAVAAEIEKLTSLSGSSPIDWALIEQQGADILATQSKDFMMAAWLSAAWLERRGLEGLQAGLQLHAGLVDTFWHTGFPPLKRLRGRRNALSWWLERASDWLANQTLAPLPVDVHHAMVDAANHIDQLLADHDPESPPLSNFVRQLKNLDVLEPPQQDAATPSVAAPLADGTHPDSTAQLNSGDTPSDNHAPSNSSALQALGAVNETATGSAPANDTGKPTLHTAAPPETTSPAPAPARVAIPQFQGSNTLSSLDDIIAALNPVAQHLGQLSSALLTLDRFHPLAVEMGRFAARAALLEVPPSQNGTTALMPPPVAIADAFQTVCSAGNADGIIEFCESRVLAFPFWLDLDRQSARGFGMLGEPGARMRNIIIKNALTFTERLPGIEQLTFADGTPFASEDTRQWLEECRAAQMGAGPTDNVSQLFQNAKKAISEGIHDQAMLLYQSLVNGSYAGRDQFRARVALAELFMATRGDADPVPFVQSLVDDCQTYNLAVWEPELASKAWQTVLAACRQALMLPAMHDEPSLHMHYRQLQSLALQHLARIDFPAALRYST